MPRLFQLSTNAYVEAAVVPNLSGEAIQATDKEWLDFQNRLVRQLRRAGRSPDTLPEHLHWHWTNKARYYQGRGGFEFVGLEYDGRTQGLILLDYTRTGRLPQQMSQPLVYVDYLAAAPWNQRSLTDTPEFKGVGRVLVGVAQKISLEQGHQGRVGLHSLPQSEGFYRDVLRMIDLGPDSQYHGLRYFELEAEGTAK